MRKILALLTSLVLVLSAAACGNTGASDETKTQENSQELTKVRVAIMTGGASHWYAVIGRDAGIFEKHGIEVEITEFAAGINTVDAVVTGQADFGNLADYACINRIGSTQENTNLVVVDRLSTSKGTSNGGLYVSDDIKSLSDLAGKGFATQAGTVWDYWVAKTYEKAGIKEADQNILNVDSPASAVALMISGEASAFWASGTNAAKLEDAGFHTLLTLDDLGLYTDAYYISTSDFLEKNEAVAEEFIKAQKETADWIYANEDEAAAIFEKAAGTTQEQFHSDLAATQLVTDFTQETLDHLNDIKSWAVENGRFADYDVLKFSDFTALKAVYPDSVTVK
ncbi:MAG: ABC transporter substrate-binding protein [Lachnospiraceae bacterium]|nr:ABC transporter substrate-binding protein [Lachnospiraceae bacterium]